MEDTDWLRAALVWDEGSRGLFPEGIEGYIIIVGASLLTASPSFMEDTDWLRAALVWDEGSRGLFPVGTRVHHHSRGVTTDGITIIHGGH